MLGKRLKIEGSPEAQLVQMIRKIGHIKDVDFETATIIAPPPSIRLKLDVDGTELDRDDVIVAGNLTAHTRKAAIDGTNRTIEFEGILRAGDVVIVASMDTKMQYIVLDKAVR